jgi:hypothetical protein
VQLLPLHNKPDNPQSAPFPQNTNKKGKGAARSGRLALANVWDEREELFGVGDDDDGDDGSAEDKRGESTAPVLPVRPETHDSSLDAKLAKSVRWAQGSS